MKLSFVDIVKAYFNGVPTRSLYVKLPKELGLPRNIVGKLRRCLYGTRDAGAIWEECYANCLTGIGFIQGKASPCSFYHPKWKVSVVVHGDDFTALGTDASLELYEKGLASSFECKYKGRLGAEDKDLKEMRVLNRILRITPDGLMYEADPRHVELLAKSMGLETCKPVFTPGMKRDFKESILDLVLDEVEEEAPVVTAPISSSKTRVTFAPKVGVHYVPEQAHDYGPHPR